MVIIIVTSLGFVSAVFNMVPLTSVEIDEVLSWFSVFIEVMVLAVVQGTDFSIFTCPFFGGLFFLYFTYKIHHNR